MALSCSEIVRCPERLETKTAVLAAVSYAAARWNYLRPAARRIRRTFRQTIGLQAIPSAARLSRQRARLGGVHCLPNARRGSGPRRASAAPPGAVQSQLVSASPGQRTY